MAIDDSETENLLRRVGRDDGSAVGRLLERYRRPLRRLVAGRLEGRLAVRVDPSDIVQEALTGAGQKLPEYVRDRPMPFYPWLRRLALDRLAKLRRFHLGMSKRSVTRERSQRLASSGQSTERLIDCLADKGTSPSGCAIRAEERERVKAALDGLTTADHRILRATLSRRPPVRRDRGRTRDWVGCCQDATPPSPGTVPRPAGQLNHGSGLRREAIDPRNTPSTRKKLIVTDFGEGSRCGCLRPFRPPGGMVIGVNFAAAIAGEGRRPIVAFRSAKGRPSSCAPTASDRAGDWPRLRVLSRSERRRNAAPYSAAPPPDRTHFVGRSKVSHAQLTPMGGWLSRGRARSPGESPLSYYTSRNLIRSNGFRQQTWGQVDCLIYRTSV